MIIYDAPPPPASEVIIVTASPLGTSKDVQNQGVIVLNRAQSLLMSVSGGIGETLSGELGVKSSFYGPNASRPIIRGLGEDRIKLLSNGLQGVDASTISPDHAPAIDGLEAQTIEILKGPAALRYGSNAIGGVVNIIDGRFPNSLGSQGLLGDVFAAYSDGNSGTSISGNLSQTIGKNIFRIDGLSRNTGDYQIPKYAQSDALRAVTLDETKDKIPNSHGDIYVLGASYNRINSNNEFGFAIRNTLSEYGIPNEEAHIKLKQTRYDFMGKMRFEGLISKLDLRASYGDYTHAEIEDTGDIGTLFSSTGYEARLEATQRKSNNFEGLFGLQSAKKDFSALGEEAFILPVKTRNLGAFFFERYSRNNFGFEFGARVENVKYWGEAGNRDFQVISGSLSGFYTPNENLRIALTYANTTRPPTETELFADGPHAATQSFEIGDTNLQAEQANSIELATTWKNESTKLTLNIWGAQFDKFISFNPNGLIEDGLAVYQATQKDADLYGFEAQIKQNLGAIGGFNFIGNLSYEMVRGQYKDDENIPRIPPSTTKIGLIAEAEQTSIHIEAEILARQNKISNFETTTDGAEVFNLGFEYRPQNYENLEFHLDANNITNQEVREHTSVLKDQIPVMGRNIVFSIRYRFY